MDRGNAGSMLVIAALVVIGTVVATVAIGWITIQAGVGRMVTIGATLIPTILSVLAVFGIGSRTSSTRIETDVNVNKEDLQLQIQGSNKEKETSPYRADFPERWAKKFRSWNIEYGTLQNLLKFFIVLGIFTVALFGSVFVALIIGQIGADVPSEFATLSVWIVSAIGPNLTMILAGGGALVATLSIVGYTELNRVFDKTTCDECDKDFCLSFDYVLYNPNTKEVREENVRDEEGNVQGVRTTGYIYKGTLYATCTTRNKPVEIEDWNWYVST